MHCIGQATEEAILLSFHKHIELLDKAKAIVLSSSQCAVWIQCVRELTSLILFIILVINSLFCAEKRLLPFKVTGV
jgi:hypothetical protein